MNKLNCPNCGYSLSGIGDDIKNAVDKEVAVKEREWKKQHQTDLELATVRVEKMFSEKLTAANEKLRASDTEKELAIIRATQPLHEEVERLKSFRARQSTKLVGESLEQHCEIEFNKLRPTAFPRVYFEKDNDAKSGTKGDYIYRESDENGTEIISIMFEMKNEEEGSTNKKRNEDFLAKLDKNRNEKKCEYAILVSMLESDNELYSGITDVSWKFPKMYVIRPQQFIPIITLLRNAAMNSLQTKNELALARSKHVDVARFEEKLAEFKTGFDKNVDLAQRKFADAIREIDTSIKHLESVRAALVSSGNNLGYASDKLAALTIMKKPKGE